MSHDSVNAVSPRKSVLGGRMRSAAVAMRVLVSLLICCLLVQSQSTQPGTDTTTTFQSKVQLVLVDVVVTDRLGQPIKGIPRDSFQVIENGHEQTIASFEEHHGDPAAPPLQLSTLPPHSFTNAPVAEPPGAVNVLLLDGLNTNFADQAEVHRQVISYLRTLEPGPHAAIFSLGSKLRMVTGFTDDPKLLLAALSRTKEGGKPNSSSMLQNAAEDRMQQTILQQMADSPMGGGGSVAPAGMINALAGFMQEMNNADATTRISLTLQALQELSRYLSAFHGRKNIIWFSGSFPQIPFPAGGDRTRTDLGGTPLESQLATTINTLAAAQVAVYPVAAQGLETQAIFQAQSLSPMGEPGQTLRERMTSAPTIEMQKERVERYTNQKAAEDIASNTGGQAFYNTNGLKDALGDVVRKGSYYYRISYSPGDKRMEGRYRHIEIKVKKGAYATPAGVSYRRGYFEEDAKHQKNTLASANLLQPLMGPGLPNSTELVYNLRLVRLRNKPEPGSPTVGDNRDMHGARTRLSADFIVPIDKLEFDTTPDGVRHGNVELALVAYDQAGNALNWVFRSLKTSVKPNLYPLLQNTGAQFHQEIDVPDGENYLRAGIYDLQAGKSGTLQVALNNVAVQEDLAAKARSVQSSVGVLASLSPASTYSDAAAPAEVNGFKLMPSINQNPALWQALASTPSPDQMQKALPPDIPQYCRALAGSNQDAAALQSVCLFAFSMTRKLPNVICDRETKRYRNDRQHAEKMLDKMAAGKAPDKSYFDVITAKVAYVNGREYYDSVRMNGLPADASAPWRAGTWSIGEFSSILVSIFLPSSKTEFRFEKEAVLQSRPAIVFDYHVAAGNNTSYFLSSAAKVWFPEYNGKLWLDKATHRLLRMQRETPYMPGYPIRRARTDIDYSNVALGDGTSLVLPTSSTALVCSQSPEYCGINVMEFAGWKKFGATTKIVTGLPR